MVPNKGNAHRDESTNIEAGEVVTYYNYLGNATQALKFGTGSGKEKSLIIKINTVFFLLKFFEKWFFDIVFECIYI